MKKQLLFFVVSCFSFQLLAQAPLGYYDQIDAKSNSELKTALHKIVRNTISLGFDTFSAQFWGDVYYKRTDWNPAGYYWDMYSNEQRVAYNSSNMAREHCMPRSWWQVTGGDQYGDANSDILNLYPSDSEANGKKSNNPLGVVTSATYDNGLVKLGKNTYGGEYTGTAFEPADEYKGDFARTYFYMVTGYEDYAARWGSEGVSMLNNETYPVFKDWAVNMLLEWHRNDPVNQKEIDRNNEAFSIQYNRNPFIDYPELVEYIWGNKKTDSYTLTNKATSPALLTPTSNTIVYYGTKAFITRDVLVKGALLTQAVDVALTAGDIEQFKIVQDAVSPGLTKDGYKLAVSYSPKAEGAHTATLSLSSSEIGVVNITLTGEYSQSAPAVDPIEPADDMDVLIYYPGPWNTTLPEGFQTNSTEFYESGNLLAFKSTNKNLIVNYNEPANILQFALKPYNAWGTNDNHIYVYESVNGSSWGTNIADFDNTNLTGNTYFNTPEIQLRPESRAVKIEYKKQAQNVGLTHLILTRAISEGVAGITADDTRLFVKEGRLCITNPESRIPVQVFDITGKVVYKNSAYTDSDAIYLNNRGIYIVKVNNRIYKVVN
ncbi:endonuclease [Viscerimonas tarda]